MIAIWVLVLGCSEYVVNQDKQRNPVEPPPAPIEDNEGDAPNWADCMEGYSGMYFNHEARYVQVFVLLLGDFQMYQRPGSRCLHRVSQ